MDLKEMWEADRLRTERVMAMQPGPELDGALRTSLNNGMRWEGVSELLPVALSAVSYLRHAHPDRVEAFAQRLLDEVAPWATAYDYMIDFDVYAETARGVQERGAATVLRILTAEPAAIVRAIILALPER